MKSPRITPSMIVAVAALVLAMSGGAVAATVLPAASVGTEQLQDDAVIAAKVKDGSLLASDFKAGELKPSNVTTLSRTSAPLTNANPRVITFHGVVPGSYLLTVGTDIAAYSSDLTSGSRVASCKLDEYRTADGVHLATLATRNAALPKASSAVSATSLSLESTFTSQTQVDVGLNCPPESGWWASNAQLTLVPLQSQGTYPANN
jgi:hypothetical protein